ncbi:zinc-binding dehydrogenase, partial [Mannheimia haemolytica]
MVSEDFVLKVSENLDTKAVAPLLCAGITTYSPLRHWNVKAGSKVAVVGLGGLGHMAVKLAKAMGAEVTLFTRSLGKADDAYRLGASRVVLSTDEKQMAD